MTTSVLESRGNIIENQQFTDPTTLDFVMRTRFETESSLAEVEKILGTGLGRFNPKLSFRPVAQKKRALILVTKESHCLRDLLYLQELGELPIEIPAVISNHGDLKALTESHSLKFIDQSGAEKQASETQIRNLIAEEKIDLIILARYMQVLSTEFCNDFAGKIINTHHSFLPGFKGAKPYHQAHDRGVKIIGATAHFVTADLDEGPIIDQDVAHEFRVGRERAFDSGLPRAKIAQLRSGMQVDADEFRAVARCRDQTGRFDEFGSVRTEFGAAASDREDGVAAFADEFVFVPDVDLHPGAAGDRVQGLATTGWLGAGRHGSLASRREASPCRRSSSPTRTIHPGRCARGWR